LLPNARVGAQNRRYRRVNVSTAAGKKQLASYRKAIRVMLALPPSDARNWYRLALVHALDCPHGNWWFLPWHRAYLGWFEQICRELGGDPDFALPYWDWTAEPRIPADMFDDVLSPTADAYIDSFIEFKQRFDSVIANLDCWKTKTKPDGTFDDASAYAQLLARGMRNPSDLWFDIFEDPRGKFFFDLKQARWLTREQPDLDADTRKTVSIAMLLDSLAPKDFITFASSKSMFHGTVTGFGVLEGQPHNNVHNNIGGMSGQKNLGGFMQANLSPVDPIFYLHHSNIDRIWDIWTRKQIGRKYPALPEGAPAKLGDPPTPHSDYAIWAREPFLFFADAKGDSVQKTSAGDYAEIGEFGYDYEPGSGEEIVAVASSQALPALVRTFPAWISTSAVGSYISSRASLSLPAHLLTSIRAAAPSKLFARITVDFKGVAHAIPLRVSVGDGRAGTDSDAPGFAGVLSMFGHHGAHGPVSFLVPISDPVKALPARNVRADAAIALTIMQPAAVGHMDAHATSTDATAEILSISVELH
jgi:tyrosinase